MPDLTPEEVRVVVRALEMASATLIQTAERWQHHGQAAAQITANRDDAATMRAIAARLGGTDG
jgi:hypothetical protein